MLSIRSGMGLGDSLYLQAVARHLVAGGQRLRVCSAWPDVFRPLGDRVEVVPFTRVGIDILAHYSKRKANPDTTQFEDCCAEAGITEPVELRLDWEPGSEALLANLCKPGKPIVCVQLPRVPMDRKDGFGADLLPDCCAIQMAIDALRDRALIVQIGAGRPLFQFAGIDVDLANRTTVSEFIDVVSVADACIGYVSFIVPLAESLNKPALLVWSRRGLRAGHLYVRQITPHKVLHKASSSFVMDDASEEEIKGAARGLLRRP